MCVPVPAMARRHFLLLNKRKHLFLCLRAICISFSGSCSSHFLLIFLSGLIISFVSESSFYISKMSTFSLM